VGGADISLRSDVTACRARPVQRVPAAPTAQPGSLLRKAFHRVGAERRVFVASLPECLIFRVSPPSPDFFRAVPDLNGNTPGRVAVKCRHRRCAISGGPSYGDEATTGCLDHGLSLWSVFLAVSVGVRHVDF
jgi:hypothetical protein